MKYSKEDLYWLIVYLIVSTGLLFITIPNVVDYLSGKEIELTLKSFVYHGAKAFYFSLLGITIAILLLLMIYQNIKKYLNSKK